MKIKVGDDNIILSSREEYKDFLAEEGVKFLRDGGGNRVGGLESLVNGGTYSLGPPIAADRGGGGGVDVSLAWTRSVSTAIRTMSDVGTNLQQLGAFLLEPPQVRARVDHAAFGSWKTLVPEETLLRYFEPVHGGDFCRALSIQISHLLFNPSIVVGENEDGCHSRLDQCITAFLNNFAPEFTLRRNSSRDSSSSPLLQPDFSATLPGHGCFFRGEEKKIGSDENPQAELYEKLQRVWPFPGLSYVLGYHSVGTVVTFSRVQVGSADDVTLPMRLDDASVRLECWNVVRNVARIIKFMALYSTSISPQDLQDIENGSTAGRDWTRIISFSGGHVQKQINLRGNETHERMKRVLAVLARIKDGVPGVQPIVSFNFSSSVVDSRKRRRVPPNFYLLTTLGEKIPMIKNTDHLRQVVRFLLQTIEELHHRGVTHRDIRLPNIVKSPVDGSYGLIDWDDSVNALHGLPNADVSHLERQSHAPEMFIEGGNHDRTVDLWSVGYLIDQNSEHADAGLNVLKTELLKAAPERPQCRTALGLLDATH